MYRRYGTWIEGSMPIDPGWYWIVCKTQNDYMVCDRPMFYTEDETWQDQIEPVAYMKISKPTLESYNDTKNRKLQKDNLYLSDIGLLETTYNILINAGIYTVGDLKEYDWKSISAIRGMSVQYRQNDLKKCLDDIDIILSEETESKRQFDNSEYLDVLFPMHIAVLLYRSGIHTIGEFKEQTWKNICKISSLSTNDKKIIRDIAKQNKIIIYNEDIPEKDV